MIYHPKDTLAEALKKGLMDKKGPTIDELEASIDKLLAAASENPSDTETNTKLKGLLADYHNAIKKAGRKSKFEESVKTPALDAWAAKKALVEESNKTVAQSVAAALTPKIPDWAKNLDK